MHAATVRTDNGSRGSSYVSGASPYDRQPAGGDRRPVLISSSELRDAISTIMGSCLPYLCSHQNCCFFFSFLSGPGSNHQLIVTVTITASHSHRHHGNPRPQRKEKKTLSNQTTKKKPPPPPDTKCHTHSTPPPQLPSGPPTAPTSTRSRPPAPTSSALPAPTTRCVSSPPQRWQRGGVSRAPTTTTASRI